MFPWSVAKSHAYLLQLENYHLRRFLRALLAHGWQRYEARQEVVWTAKLKAIAASALVIQGAVAVAAFYGLADTLELPLARFLAAFGVFAVAGWLFGAWLALATLLVAPADMLVKRLVVARAQRQLARHPNLAIIAITGSYGKTTMKEMLAAVLAEKYTVLKTAGNQNTPLGLSRLISTQLTAETEILIVEMGAYGPGDIRELCRIAPPHISVLTGINEAHLERFGSLETTAHTKFEIVRHARPDAFVVLNADDERVRAAAADQVQAGQTVRWYSGAGAKESECRITEPAFDAAALQQSATVQCGSFDLGTVRTKLLADYVWGDIAAAALVAERLHLTPAEVRRGIAALEPLPHRLQPIKGAGGIIVIDDSYNGNPAGARAAISLLSRFTEQRRVYVTPGLVEMGDRSEAVHEELGRALAPVADVVIVVTNSVSEAIKRGLRAAGFPAEAIVECPSAAAAHAQVKERARPGDVILFQNDWPDNYA